MLKYAGIQCNKTHPRLGISDGTGLIAVNGVGGVLGLLLVPLLRQDGLLTTGKTTAAVGLGIITLFQHSKHIKCVNPN